MPRNATTDPESGLRYYQWQGKDLLSVTSLRRLIGMPFQLANRQVGQVVDAAVTMYLDGSLEKLLMDPLMDGTKAVATAKTALRKLAMQNRDRAADVGTRVHEAAERRIDVDKAEAEVAPFLRMFYKAEKATGIEIVHAEKQVFNPTLGYGGTLDWLGLRAGRTVLGDNKTGKGLYTEHLIQLILYAIAEVVGADDVIDHEATAMLLKVDTLGILHLRPTEWEWVELDPSPEAFRAAKQMVGLANFIRDNNNIEKHIVSRLHGE